ncbi:carboxypeptidase-like regulatory domain-containing protein [Actinotalea sp. K2]|uniref:carboxypeptidase-like regulatory domain-containing protein n=1 Tax=Actinotalea sp. K2 TaxID=2939438 RepID=UPI0020179516|nr:carboxypeptidase-like regulatory domain-containing protein [Actinotalea sp. K2]MCL3861865.1 carboxypeptidase regulatory-like domain-containing protein [Actinotalea sp. K2]
MRVLSTVDVLDVAPGGAGEIPLEVVNTGTVIDGVTAHVLGLPVDLATSRPAVLPLFPDATGHMVVQLDLPSTFPAGTHPVTVQVTGQVPGGDVVHHDVSVVVGSRPDLALAASPTVIRARRRATFEVQVRNQGNVALDVALRANDSDRTLQCAITPSTVSVEPGATARCAVQVKGPRQLVGGDRDRPLRVEATALDQHEVVSLVLRQRSLLSRGLLTALVLLAIVGVWAAIFLLGIRQVLGSEAYTKSAPPSFFAATSDPADGAAGVPGAMPAGSVSRDGVLAAGVGGTLAGTVLALSDGEGVGRITVEAWRTAGDGSRAVVGSAATQEDGTFAVAGIFPGSYLVSFRGEGYETVWYPAATGPADAAPVFAVGQTVTDGVDVTVSGAPATIRGTVDVGDVTSPVVAQVVARAMWDREDESSAQTVEAAPDGTYVLAGLPAPGTYELTFTAEGYLPTTTTEHVDGGQERFATTVDLGSGTGQISGTVTDGRLPLGGVEVSTTVDGTDVVVGTPTVGMVGAFVIPLLPTPGTYVVTFTKEGFTPATVVVDLSAGGVRSDLVVALGGGAGTVTGRVLATDGTGLGGASVTVGGGPSTVQATSLTTGTVGAFTLAGLEPGLYSLTATLAGYAPQSVAVDLTGGTTAPVAVTMRPSWGTVRGVVRDAAGAGASGVEVQATDGRQVWTTISTAVAGRSAGDYVFAQLPPGTYAVTLSRSGRVVETAVVAVQAGGSASQDLRLPAVR